MRVVICMKHNELMEQSRPESAYVFCASCKRERTYDPYWFPIALAMQNHRDGAMRRIWEATYTVWTKSNWQWNRVKEDQ